MSRGITNIEVGKVYEDREGKQWRITSTTDQRIAPVVGARWEGERYHVRTFKWDGRYWGEQESKSDLIREVQA